MPLATSTLTPDDYPLQLLGHEDILRFSSPIHPSPIDLDNYVDENRVREYHTKSQFAQSVDLAAENSAPVYSILDSYAFPAKGRVLKARSGTRKTTGYDEGKSSFHAMATHLDNSKPLIPAGGLAQGVDWAVLPTAGYERKTSSRAMVCSLPTREIAAWATNNTPPSARSSFPFPPTPRSEHNYLGTSRPAKSSTELALLSLKELKTTRSNVPSLLIRSNDIIGDRRIVSNEDGFMFYDPNVATVHEVIARHGIPITGDGNPHEAPGRGVVRVYLEIPYSIDLFLDERGERNVDDPYFRYAGEFILCKTNEALSKEMWKTVREEQKDVVVNRFIDSATRHSKGVNASRRHVTADIRKWYDNGGVLPLVVLKPANVIRDRPTSMLGENASVYLRTGVHRHGVASHILKKHLRVTCA